MNRDLLLWVLGGVGVVLLYAAVKNKNPGTVVTTAITATPPKATAKTGNGVAAPSAPKVPKVPSVGVAGTPAKVSGSYWVTDSYGNPVSEIPAAYQTSPNTYMPPNVVA